MINQPPKQNWSGGVADEEGELHTPPNFSLTTILFEVILILGYSLISPFYILYEHIKDQIERFRK